MWHLTSPTPYDPPLTYGGWTQSRALGARIASILRTRETDDDVMPTSAETGNDKTKGDERRRRHKVIIHSSPFLRCVQTSIAISAGLAQSPGRTRTSRPSSAHSSQGPRRTSPRARPTVSTENLRLASTNEPPSPLANGVTQAPHVGVRKSTIRVDAFLGEWLSPDYFELITPPPGSVMMVAGAKADLLRLEDYNHLIQVREVPSLSAVVGFPGGWGSPVIAPDPGVEDGPLSTMPTLSQSLPRRDRSFSSASGESRRNIAVPPFHSPDHGIYQPPIPSYSISNADPIPQGYVAHARDACVEVDYQWDSMREPFNWGDGGEYGEEWSSMHKRFRKGLQNLVRWYSDTEDAATLVTKLHGKHDDQPEDDSEALEDDETDLVIILVTHGAGCNALIGALTNQPVLMDVGMASLTMAVRKNPPKTAPLSTPNTTPKSHSRSSSRTLVIPEEYDVKLVANTEHLRSSAVNTPSSSRTSSLAPISSYRQRHAPNTGAPFVEHSTGRETSRSIPTSGNFGSIRRTANVPTTSSSRTYSSSPVRPSIGLWSAPRRASVEIMEQPGDDLVLNFGDETAVASPSSKVEETPSMELEEDEVAPLGLWGTPRPPGAMEGINREIGTKRRWTFNEPGNE